MISPQKAGKPDAENDLKAEKGVTAAEHSGSDSTGPLSRCSLLSPEPANAAADAPATDLNQPTHDQIKNNQTLVMDFPPSYSF